MLWQGSSEGHGKQCPLKVSQQDRLCGKGTRRSDIRAGLQKEPVCQHETGKGQEQRRPGLGIRWGRVYLFMNTSTDICRPGGGGAFWANECLLIKASPDANTEKHPESWPAHGFQDKGGHGRAHPLRKEPLPWLGLHRPGWIKFQCQQ